MTRHHLELPEALHRSINAQWRAEHADGAVSFDSWLDQAIWDTVLGGEPRYGHPDFDQGPTRLISVGGEPASWLHGYAEARGMMREQLLAQVVAEIAGEPCS